MNLDRILLLAGAGAIAAMTSYVVHQVRRWRRQRREHKEVMDELAHRIRERQDELEAELRSRRLL